MQQAHDASMANCAEEPCELLRHLLNIVLRNGTAASECILKKINRIETFQLHQQEDGCGTQTHWLSECRGSVL
jgi:hypothetical protein